MGAKIVFFLETTIYIKKIGSFFLMGRFLSKIKRM